MSGDTSARGNRLGATWKPDQVDFMEASRVTVPTELLYEWQILWYVRLLCTPSHHRAQ